MSGGTRKRHTGYAIAAAVDTKPTASTASRNARRSKSTRSEDPFIADEGTRSRATSLLPTIRESDSTIDAGKPATMQAHGLPLISAEAVMTHTFSPRWFFGEVGRFLEHGLAVALGLVMIVVGLALG